MRYVSLDIETTGLDPDTCQVIEIGAVVDDFLGVFDEEKATETAFHCYVKHPIITGEPYALSMHRDIFRILSSGDQRIFTSTRVAGQFRAWLDRNGWSNRDKVLFAGKNFAFDKSFLHLLPDWKRLIPSFHRNLDPAMLYFNPLLEEAPPSLSDCLARAGLSPDVSHRAVDDAMDVIKLLRKGYNC